MSALWKRRSMGHDLAPASKGQSCAVRALPISGGGAGAGGVAARCSWRRLAQELGQKYEVGAVMNAGSVGVVRQARSLKTDQQLALKFLNSSDEELRQYMREEYEIMRKLKHPAIVHVHELCENPREMCIVMDICAGGSVEEYVSKHGMFSEATACSLFAQLLTGVDFLHQKRIVHRDVKAENVLLDHSAKVLKIGDFNSAKQIGDALNGEQMLTDRGTYYYRAPELLFGRFWNERVDVWATGLCMYFMLKAILPFNVTKTATKECLVGGRLPEINFDTVSGIVQNLVCQCLTVDMRDRPPAMELRLHPVFEAPEQGDPYETLKGMVPTTSLNAHTFASEGLSPTDEDFRGTASMGLWSCPDLEQLPNASVEPKTGGRFHTVKILKSLASKKWRRDIVSP